MLNKIVLTFGGLFLMFVLTFAVGFGVWAFSLNAQLTQAQADFEALKSSNEKLNSDYSDLNTGSAKTNADLTAAQAQIESLQGELEKERAENDSLKTQISAVQAKVSILVAWQFGTDEAFSRKVNTSGDAELKALWEKAQKTNADEDYWKVQDYLIQSIGEMAGSTLLPNLVVNDG